MKTIVTYSGGKDSLATLLWAKNNCKDFIVVFCNTNWESEKTYKHIEYVENELNIKIKELRSHVFDGMIDMVRRKSCFPSTTRRFCTEELKVKPMIDFVLGLQEDVLILQGIRAQESIKRSAMSEQCTFFKHYFQPYSYDKKTGKPKYFSYRKAEVKEFVKHYAHEIHRPIFDKTDAWVFSYIAENGLKPNPLYLEGFGRVGCFPCIMSTLSEMYQFVMRYPERLEEIAQYEEELNTTFFPPNYIPSRYCSKIVVNKKGIAKKINTMRDVIRYLKDKHATIKLDYANNTKACASIYNLCE